MLQTEVSNVSHLLTFILYPQCATLLQVELLLHGNRPVHTLEHSADDYSEIFYINRLNLCSGQVPSSLLGSDPHKCWDDMIF